ncbi:hypothetical protein [Taibaiella chishuiensis]|uniref:Uncharacterized protein n=1 Tax=Taibaiella chishuiensis TaxID=1434707 RepID=A0A2P8DBP1_9BACT|nr:hypothetical protein [Taibaiella chishuiensis]PSK94648.1 hypothetical protein B0I18_101808 [Taibaiella chishuiensis]
MEYAGISAESGNGAGKVSRVWTNGAELKGSPDWITNDLNTLIKSAIPYDMDKNRNSYFLPHKTQTDFKKEDQAEFLGDKSLVLKTNHHFTRPLFICLAIRVVSLQIYMAWPLLLFAAVNTSFFSQRYGDAANGCILVLTPGHQLRRHALLNTSCIHCRDVKPGNNQTYRPLEKGR